MARKKRVVKQGPEASLVTGLFGNVTELGDEELKLIYDAIAPDEDAAAVVESLTSEAAERYTIRNKPCPGHVRAAAYHKRSHTG
jgi:hypothetical protein